MQPDLFAADTSRQALEQLREIGVLRDLDVAVARFLIEQQPDLDPAVALIAALASAQLAAGHLCLDLSEPGLAERLWPDTASAAGSSPASASTARPLAAELLPDDPHHWRALLAASPIVDQPDTDSGAPLVLEGERLYLRRHWRLEGKVAQGIAARLAHRHPPPAELRQRLADLFMQDGHTLDWQQIACALAVRNSLTLITGGPGTGKTTTVVKLLGLLQGLAFDQGRRLRIRLAAPTGKAAARLTDSIGEQVARLPVDDAVRDAIPTEVTTLHRLLGTRHDSRHFRHHAHNPLHADLVVVDEASMIDMDMMASLLDALDPQTRLVLLGDKDQLASVEAGAVLGDLCQDADIGGYDAETLAYLRHYLTDPDQPSEPEDALTDYAGHGGPLAQQTAMLRKNWRFQDGPGIGELAAAINAGDDATVVAAMTRADSALTRLKIGQPPDDRLRTLMLDGEDGLRELFETASTAPAHPRELDPWARECLQRLGRRQLLSGLRSGPFGVEQLNQDITDWLRQADLAGEREWYAGRPVMLVRNDYQLGLMNGDVGLTLPHPDGLRVAFPVPGGRIRWVLPSRLEGVETVYAMTVHKSQGSEFRHTLLILPDHPHPLLTRELIYTAVTRARQAFTLIEAGSSTVLKRAVRQRTWRASGLADKLRV